MYDCVSIFNDTILTIFIRFVTNVAVRTLIYGHALCIHISEFHIVSARKR